MADNILGDFGINILEEEIDDVIFQTDQFSVMLHSWDIVARFGTY